MRAWTDDEPGSGVMGEIDDLAEACERMASSSREAGARIRREAARASMHQVAGSISVWVASAMARAAEADRTAEIAHSWAAAARHYAQTVSHIATRADFANDQIDRARRVIWHIDSLGAEGDTVPTLRARHEHATDEMHSAQWRLRRLAQEREEADAAFVASLRSRSGVVAADPSLVEMARRWARGALPRNAYDAFSWIVESWLMVHSTLVGDEALASYTHGSNSESGPGSVSDSVWLEGSFFGGLFKSYAEARTEANASADADADFSYGPDGLNAWAYAQAQASASAGLYTGYDMFNGMVTNDTALTANANAYANAGVSSTSSWANGSQSSLYAAAMARIDLDYDSTTTFANGYASNHTNAAAYAEAGAWADATMTMGPNQVGQHMSFGGTAAVGLEAREDIKIGALSLGGGASIEAGVGGNYAGGWDLGWEHIGASIDLGFALGPGVGADVYVDFSPKQAFEDATGWLW